jgi:hypothetical protein
MTDAFAETFRRTSRGSLAERRASQCAAHTRLTYWRVRAQNRTFRLSNEWTGGIRRRAGGRTADLNCSSMPGRQWAPRDTFPISAQIPSHKLGASPNCLHVSKFFFTHEAGKSLILHRLIIGSKIALFRPKTTHALALRGPEIQGVCNFRGGSLPRPPTWLQVPPGLRLNHCQSGFPGCQPTFATGANPC